jgi:hypothetical protein
MAEYRVTVWDKKANDPYMILNYDDEDTAKYVARRMKKHYIDDWGQHAEEYYEIRLHRMKETSNE